jgi:hypothetical protein
MPANFSVNLNAPLRRQVGIVAAVLGISQGEFIRRACTEALARQAETNPQIAAHVTALAAQ